MSKFDEFDLDLQVLDGAGQASVVATANCTTVAADSIGHCAKESRGSTALCSTCCTGYTVPQGCRS